MPTDLPTERLYEILREQGLDFFVSVPCKLLSGLIGVLEKEGDILYTPVTREEEGVGICVGAYMAGRRPVLVMQNSGFGNALNAICSLANYYRIPLVFVASHRGSPGEPIEAQVPMGDAVGGFLDVANIEHHAINDYDDLEKMGPVIDAAWREKRSVAFLLPFSYWQQG